MHAFWIYPALFLTGLAAGFVDSIAGGGGLITLPVLLSTGINPVDAIGTNKLQAIFGSGSAMVHYASAGMVRWADCREGVIFTLIGAVIGSILVQRIDPGYLRQAIPVLLIVIAFYLLLRPNLGSTEARARMTLSAFNVCAGLTMGFYDGFFGPGTGSLWAMAYVLLLGLDLTRATAHTKVMNFTSNVGSIAVFAFSNHMLIGAGVAMGVGQMLGARIGARSVIRQGARLIRPIFIAVVLLISARLLWQSFTRP